MVPSLPQAFRLKRFHDLYLLSRGAGQDIYTSFANFKGAGTNSPAIPSLIPVLGRKESRSHGACLTPASTSTTKDNTPRFFPAKTNFPRKHHWRECAQQLLQNSALLCQHTAVNMKMCIRRYYKDTVLWNLYVIRHLHW